MKEEICGKRSHESWGHEGKSSRETGNAKCKSEAESNLCLSIRKEMDLVGVEQVNSLQLELYPAALNRKHTELT